jgi:hypothetical protein
MASLRFIKEVYPVKPVNGKSRATIRGLGAIDRKHGLW